MSLVTPYPDSEKRAQFSHEENLAEGLGETFSSVDGFVKDEKPGIRPVSALNVAWISADHGPQMYHLLTWSKMQGYEARLRGASSDRVVCLARGYWNRGSHADELAEESVQSEKDQLGKLTVPNIITKGFQRTIYLHAVGFEDPVVF